MDQKLESQTLEFFLDTEFDDERDDCTILPISVGFINEAGDREFYSENADYDESGAHEWLKEQVLPKLGPVENRQTRAEMRESICDYFNVAVKAANETGAPVKKIKIWYKNGALDQATLSMIFGGLSKFYGFMNTLGVERTYFNDTDTLRQTCPERVKIERPADQMHHAMHDARNERTEYLEMRRLINERRRELRVQAVIAAL